MKKILAIALALMLALGMLSALADADITNDDSTVTIKKVYKTLNGGISPAETFSFSEFTEVSADNDTQTFPTGKPSITAISYAEGEATSDGTGTGTKTATITLPAYNSVGVYTYSFYELTPATKTAGVTYREESNLIYLVVTVVQGSDNKLRVAAVHCEGGHDQGEYGTSPKTDSFENTYEAGQFVVGKDVTGLLGDRAKTFAITVTFAAKEGEQINSKIKYQGNADSSYYSASSDGTVMTESSITLNLKHGDQVTFSNVPKGVTYTVSEADYTADGYTSSISSATGTTGAQAEPFTVTVTNHKQGEIDTGITLDTLPYVLLLAVAALGAALFLIRGRRREED